MKSGYVKVKVLNDKEVEVINKNNNAEKEEFNKKEKGKKTANEKKIADSKKEQSSKPQSSKPQSSKGDSNEKYEEYEVQEYKTPEKYDIQILNTKWKEISWDDQNTILRSSVVKDQMTRQDELDNIMYNDTLLKQALTGWDLSDDNGQPVPCTPETIGQLPYTLLRNLMSKYERIVFLGEDDEKKS